MILPKREARGSRQLEARRGARNVSRGAGWAALFLAWSCTDARVPQKPADEDSGVDKPAVVEAGATAVNSSTSDAVDASECGLTITPDGAFESTSEIDASDAAATSSMTSATTPTDAGANALPDADASGSGPELPAFCENLPAAPVAAYALYGFTQSEDFAFDELGNYVGVDEFSNLVRVSQVGRQKLWAPNVAGTTAGMSILPDGSLVLCDVGEGSIKRIHPNGYIQTVLAGLEYPNGLDIGPDGFIYVAENNAGRVRRINPDTGEFTIVAIGLYGPNGVAFGNDPAIMYIGSFEGSGVYRVDIPAPGELGQARVLTRPNGSELPDPKLACPDQVVGQECRMGFAHGALGKCQQVANVVDCFRYDRCPELTEGSPCDYPENGVCTDGVCKPPCEGKEPWDSCVPPYGGEDGVCAPQDDDTLLCRESSPCDQKDEGDTCTLDGVAGTCSLYSEYFGYGNASELHCEVPGPCDDKEVGDECTSYDVAGTCDEYHECVAINPCEGQEDGAACENPYNHMPGTCVVYDEYYGSESYAYCQEIDPCMDHAEGDACLGYEGPGTCVLLDGSWMYCEVAPCADKEVGEPCYSATAGQGTCVAGDASAELSCYVPPACEGKQEGDSCSFGYSEAGICTQGDDGLSCQRPPPCAGLSAGDTCYDYDLGEGQCATVGDALECVVPCAGLSAGDACQGADGPGVCVDHGGYLNCEPPDPCATLAEGDACTAGFGAGTCVLTSSSPPYYYYPYGSYTSPPAAESLTAKSFTAKSFTTPVVLSGQPLALTADAGAPNDGGAYADAAAASDAGSHPGFDAGASADASPLYDGGGLSTPAPADGGGYPEWPTFDAGYPEWPSYDGGGYPEPEPTLTCLPTGDCSTLPEGAACATPQQQLGSCFIGKCYPQEGPGGIDGLGVDACGNIYAAEYVVGNVWRIAPDGTTELLTKLPSSWIPNIKWGRGLGGFSSDVMYVADRNEGRLFGVMVGVPGATEFFDIGNQ